MNAIEISHKQFTTQAIEVVERKCDGHPDSLADGLAETLSMRYSQYTKQRFGAILHHNFDKLALLGGASAVAFGSGSILSPIRVHINGRASMSFGDDEIPLNFLLAEWTKDFFRQRLPLLNVDNDLDIVFNLSTQSSPGHSLEGAERHGPRSFWFKPRSLEDLQELRNLVSNDSSIGVGYAPYSPLERFVLALDRHLFSKSFRSAVPWLGSDIKILASQCGSECNLTLAVPQIARCVPSLDDYLSNVSCIRDAVSEQATIFGIQKINIHVNTRDKPDVPELYLTAVGSSIESGDEGLVGRGNRVNGMITPCRPMSIEGVCGKNPVYHVGKLYCVFAMHLANIICETFGTPCEVYLVSQSGRALNDPWITAVVVEESFSRLADLRSFVAAQLLALPALTDLIISGGLSLF
ncbi:MAG: methionine adenosyltransferase [Chthoniobacter sp.]|nr:methionine adenosyltransferase [Chthoniobacter sp.]